MLWTVDLWQHMATSRPRDKSASAPLSTVSVTQFIIASVLFQFFLSYIITESWTWGYKSKWIHPKSWKYLIVKLMILPVNFRPLPSALLKKSLRNTMVLIQISRYILLSSSVSIPTNLTRSGDVFDVSANRRVYGPKGSYSFFAGKDAARAFVTGCFKEDLTHDVRGLDPSQLEVKMHTSPL